MSALSFRPSLPGDAPLLAAIFSASILELGEEHYSEAQLAAWSSFGDDARAFGQFLAPFTTIVAETGGEILGFASLEDNRNIKMLYVRPEAARSGVGAAMVNVMELLAYKRGAKELTVDASDVARALFEKLGYEAHKRNTVMIEDEWLSNTTMKKTLQPPQAAGNA